MESRAAGKVLLFYSLLFSPPLQPSFHLLLVPGQGLMKKVRHDQKASRKRIKAAKKMSKVVEGREESNEQGQAAPAAKKQRLPSGNDDSDELEDEIL